MAAPQRGFFQQGILRDGAPQREHDVALSLLRSAEERAARANHGSKDNPNPNPLRGTAASSRSG